MLMGVVNVVISVEIFASQLFCIGYTDDRDVRSRLQLYGTGLTFVAFVFTTTIMITVVWIEPTMCTKWFANAGGHIWFDISLFTVMLVAVMNTNDANAKMTNININTN